MYTLIINPTSGRGAALAALPGIEATLREFNLEYKVFHADSPSEATRLAREAGASGCEGIIAVGGDGTCFQIINGLAGSKIPLIFVACGTGNDFVRCLNLPKDPLEALRLQLQSPVSQIDFGRMNDIHFLNVSGTGFDVDVLRFAEKHKKKHSGLSAYLFALVEALKTYRPTTAKVSFDDQPEEKLSFAILSIGNGRYIGGGMCAVPDADVADGLFDVVIVKPVKKFLILPLIVFFILGKHISIGLGTVKRCKKLRVSCEGMTLNLDGELRNADVANFELLASALQVRIPRK